MTDQISDAEVEAACKVHNVGWSMWREPQKKTAREVMRSALAAARRAQPSAVSVGDDLVERLREQAAYLEKAYGWTGCLEEAASQLAAVTAERDALGQQIERMEYSDGDAEHWRHLATRMEAQLKAAREALEFYAEPSNYKGEFIPGGYTDHGTFAMSHHVNLVRKDAGAIARAALNPKAPS